MASSITTMSHIKHVNIRCKYVNEYFEEGVVKIIFVKSAENDSHILTKNLSDELHKKHSKKMIGGKLECFPSFEKYLKFKGNVLEMWF